MSWGNWHEFASYHPCLINALCSQFCFVQTIWLHSSRHCTWWRSGHYCSSSTKHLLSLLEHTKVQQQNELYKRPAHVHIFLLQITTWADQHNGCTKVPTGHYNPKMGYLVTTTFVQGNCFVYNDANENGRRAYSDMICVWKKHKMMVLYLEMYYDLPWHTIQWHFST